jgi:hypothetical protein
MPALKPHFALVALLLVSLSLSGCPGQPADRERERPVQVPPAPEPVEEFPPDNPDALQALEAAGVALTTNEAGVVIAADCKAATVTDEVARHFAGLPSLTTLSLENSEVTNDGLAFLEHLPQLKVLSLRRCSNLDDDGLVHLEHVPNLERLLLLYTRTTNDGLKHLTHLDQLKVLDLRGCMQVGDAGLEHLTGLTNLVDVKLRSYYVTDAGLKDLGQLTNLRYLSLEDCGIGNEGMAYLAPLKDLRVLNVMRTLVGDDGLVHLADCRLQDLRLRETSVSGPGLDHLENSRESLTYLDLSETLISNEGVAHVAPFTNLKTLLLWNGSLDDDGVALLEGLTELEELDLQGCAAVTSGSAESLAKLPNLRVLNLSETAFDDDGLETLAGLEQLKLLKLAQSGVTDAGITRFRERRPDCKLEL